MASLPPKPESPLTHDHRPSRDGVPTARPMAPPLSPPPPSQPHHRTERFSDSDRSRSRPERDTYIAPYDSRRPPLRDWERDRPRDRDRDRRRDPRRDWRDDRRDSRPYDRTHDDDRFRPRRYDSAYRRSRSPRSRSPFRRRSRSPLPRRYSPSGSPRRSRSPTRSPRRRPYSPRPRARVSSRSRSPLPPTKRLKLGNHSISDSPRTPRARSRSYARSRSCSRSRSPRRASHHHNKTPPPSTKEKNPSPVVASRPLSPKRTDSAPPLASTSTLDDEFVAVAPKVTEIPTVKTETLKPQTPIIFHPQDHPMHPTPDHPITPELREDSVRMDLTRGEHSHLKSEIVGRHSSSTPKPDIRMEPRGRSHSPPKGPRGSQWRKTSKSPPKAPRNHGSSTPSMMPTSVPPPIPIPVSGPMYPTGPRADRRPKDPQSDLPVLRSLDFLKTTPPTSDRWAKASQQPGPKGRYGVTQLELDPVRYRSHRVNLNQDHDQISRNTRRALHELDMATIDLRMAEARRKIADAQVEKAKLGMLGIDGVSPDSTTLD